LEEITWTQYHSGSHFMCSFCIETVNNVVSVVTWTMAQFGGPAKCYGDTFRSLKSHNCFLINYKLQWWVITTIYIYSTKCMFIYNTMIRNKYKSNLSQNPYTVCYHCFIWFMIVPSPSTIIVAFDIPKPSLEQPTKEQLFLDVILLIVKLAGLADGDVSGVLTCGKEWGSPTLAAKVAMSPWTFKSMSQSTPLSGKLLLQVNVTFPLSGTTYPPGAGRASADRVTICRKDRPSESQCVQNVLLTY